MGTRPSCLHSFISSSLFTMKAVIIFVALLAAATATKTKLDTKGLACDICMDVIGDLDNFLTDDTTQEEILSFVKELCQILGENFENQCNAMFDENLPAIIDAIVNDNMNPTEVLHIDHCLSMKEKSEGGV